MVKASFPWARALAVVLFLFALGHTLGTAAPRVTRGAPEAALFAAMQGYQFRVMGFERSYWLFYRGFALTISVLLFAMAALAWQLQPIVRHDPRRAMPLAITLLLGCVGLAVLSWLFFFGPPIVFAMLAVACAAMMVAALGAAPAATRDPATP